MQNDRCPTCMKDLRQVIKKLENDFADSVLGVDGHPMGIEPGLCFKTAAIECSECGAGIEVDLEASMSVLVEAVEARQTHAGTPRSEAVAAFFAKSPSEYVFPVCVKCEACGRDLGTAGRTAKELMDSGHRVGHEYPLCRVTCPDCAGSSARGETRAAA